MGDWIGAATLLKAADNLAQRAEGEVPEDWMAPIESNVAIAGGQARGDLMHDAPLLFAHFAKSQEAGGSRVSLEQLAELKALVRQHYLSRLTPDARAAFWAIPLATRERWRRLGLLGPTAGFLSVTEQIDDAVIAARVAEILETTTSYAEMRRLAAARPQTRVQELAGQLAREHAGRALDFLADRHAHALLEVAARSDLTAFQQMLAHFMAGELPGVRTTSQLAGALRSTLGGDEFERDWQRIAVSETRWAYNYATLIHYQEQGRERVYYRVQPDACGHCKRLLLLPDGSPRIFALDDLLENVVLTGGINQGRSAALIGRPGGWLPTALIHPWCRCSPQPYLAGLPPVPVGDQRRGGGVDVR